MGVDLLIEKNSDKAVDIALKLDQLNNKRKILTSAIELEAIGIVESQIQSNSGKIPDIIIVSNDDWHEGVLGIVAGRLKDKYNRPCCVISFKNDIGKGSGRSLVGISLGDLFMKAMDENLLLKGGGHDLAAGLTISKKQLNSFIKFAQEKILLLNKDFKPVEMSVANILSAASCNHSLAKWIEKLGPWGEGAPEPKFIIENAKVKNVRKFGVNKEHVSFLIYDNSGEINCKRFNILNTPLEKIIQNRLDKSIDFLGHLKIDTWNNRNKPEFHLIDAII